MARRTGHTTRSDVVVLCSPCLCPLQVSLTVLAGASHNVHARIQRVHLAFHCERASLRTTMSLDPACLM